MRSVAANVHFILSQRVELNVLRVELKINHRHEVAALLMTVRVACFWQMQITDNKTFHCEV